MLINGGCSNFQVRSPECNIASEPWHLAFHVHTPPMGGTSPRPTSSSPARDRPIAGSPLTKLCTAAGKCTFSWSCKTSVWGASLNLKAVKTLKRHKKNKSTKTEMWNLRALFQAEMFFQNIKTNVVHFNFICYLSKCKDTIPCGTPPRTGGQSIMEPETSHLLLFVLQQTTTEFKEFQGGRPKPNCLRGGFQTSFCHVTSFMLASENKQVLHERLKVTPNRNMSSAVEQRPMPARRFRSWHWCCAELLLHRRKELEEGLLRTAPCKKIKIYNGMWLSFMIPWKFYVAKRTPLQKSAFAPHAIPHTDRMHQHNSNTLGNSWLVDHVQVTKCWWPHPKQVYTTVNKLR